VARAYAGSSPVEETNFMEFVKSEVIVDPNYRPSLGMDYMQYFTRALNFAQTNYPEQLTKLANLHFRKIVPTIFFESYTWNICNIRLDNLAVSQFFPLLREQLHRYSYQFNTGKNSVNQDLMYGKTLPIVGDPEKCQAICKTANIINQGIKIFGWPRYRDNFLSTPKKLRALPLINETNSLALGFDIGYHKQICNSGLYLQKMAACWNFQSVECMCDTIAERVALQPRVIALILWYAGYHFGTVIATP
jgi:hypothetical protein